MRFDNKTNKQRAVKVSIGELSGVTIPAVTGSDATLRKYAAGSDNSEWQDMAKAAFNDVIVQNLNRQDVRELLEPELERLYSAESALYEANREAMENGNADQVRENIRQYGMFLLNTAINSGAMPATMTAEKQGDTPSLSELPNALRNTPEGERDALVARVRAAWLRANPDKSRDDLPAILKMGNDDMKPEEVAKLQADLVVQTALAQMTDAQKAHYATLTDDTAKDSFVKMSSEARAAHLDLLKMSDETYELSTGNTLSKSAVGANMFNMLKSQDEELVKLKANAELSTFMKTADSDDYKHLPGTTVAKAAMLKTVAGMPTEVSDTLSAALKAGNASMAKSFTQSVVDGSEMAKAEDKLDSLAKTYAGEHSVSYAKAYSQVLSTPEGAKLYAESMGD